MERTILRHLQESRSIGTYKGYQIKMNNDNLVVIYKSSTPIAQFEDESSAYEYIDTLLHHNHSTVKPTQYVLKIWTDRDEFYLCKDSHYRAGRYVTNKDLRLFNSKNQAEQAFRASSKYMDQSRLRGHQVLIHK